MPIPDPPTEAAIAEWLGVPRASLAHVRTDLTPGDDFANVQRQGITFTPEGLEKIQGALPVPWAEAESRAGSAPEKNDAPPVPAPETLTLRVKQRTGNGRTVLCAPADAPADRLWVMPSGREKATTLMPGMLLPGCVRLYDNNPTIYVYHGPLPRRLGQPMPEQPKPEAPTA